MSNVTIATVNKELKRMGVEERLYKGEGYFYFIYGDAPDWVGGSSVPVFRASDLTLDQWIEEFNSLKNHEKI
jgi:hypothetical protein